MKTLILTRMMQYFAQLSTRLPIQQEANITFKMLPVGLAKAALRLMRNCTKTGFIHATHFELESNAVLSLVTYDYICKWEEIRSTERRKQFGHGVKYVW